MNEKLRRLWKTLYPPLEPDILEAMEGIRPFLYMVMLGMVFIYGVVLYGQPEMRTLGKFLPFTVVMIVHGFLHVNYIRFLASNRRGLVYLLVQIGIGLVLTVMTRNMAMPYGLFMSILGEAAGFLGLTPLGWVAMALTLVGSAVSFTIIDGFSNLGSWAITALPMTVFILIYVIMFRRQSEAWEKSNNLLKELEKANQQLADYADQVEDLTLAAERQRMARELHDTLSQGLAGLILQLEAVSAHLENNRVEKSLVVVQQAMVQARETLKDARQAISDLREMAGIQHIDLAEMAQNEVVRFETATGIPCELQCFVNGVFSETVIETIQRTLAECLMNTARHAEAQHAWVYLQQTKAQLILEVGDDGKGFNPQQMIGLDGHFGLLGLRERSRLAKGDLEINSQPGLGTTIRLIISADQLS